MSSGLPPRSTSHCCNRAGVGALVIDVNGNSDAVKFGPMVASVPCSQRVHRSLLDAGVGCRRAGDDEVPCVRCAAFSARSRRRSVSKRLCSFSSLKTSPNCCRSRGADESTCRGRHRVVSVRNTAGVMYGCVGSSTTARTAAPICSGAWKRATIAPSASVGVRPNHVTLLPRPGTSVGRCLDQNGGACTRQELYGNAIILAAGTQQSHWWLLSILRIVPA